MMSKFVQDRFENSEALPKYTSFDSLVYDAISSLDKEPGIDVKRRYVTKIELKMFRCEIQNDHDPIDAEINNHLKITDLRSVDVNMIQCNYNLIKRQVKA